MANKEIKMKHKLTSVGASLSLLLLVSNSEASLVNTGSAVKGQVGISVPPTTYVGYWNNLNTNNAGTKKNPTLAQTAQAGYNMIPIAFGVIQGTTVSFYNNGYNNNGYGVDVNQAGLFSDVAAAHAAGAKVLLSFGGGSNSTFSWNPDPNNAIGAADNVVDFLAANHLDGMDFDIEAGMNQNPTYLAEFISELRKNSASRSSDFPYGFYVSGAPQFVSSTQFQWNGWDSSTNINSLLSSTKCSDQPCFDFLNLQNYNNNQLLLSNAYQTALNQLNTNNNNGKTAIVIGYPATPQDGDNYLIPETVNSQMQEVLGKPQFGGIMVWTASNDYTNQSPAWNFISTIKTTPIPGNTYFILQISNTGEKYTSATIVVNGGYWLFANAANQPIAPGANQSWGTLASSNNPATPGVLDSGNLDNIFTNPATSFTASRITINGYPAQSTPIDSPTAQYNCSQGENYVFHAGHSYNLLMNEETGACEIKQVNY